MYSNMTLLMNSCILKILVKVVDVLTFKIEKIKTEDELVH